MRKQRSLIVTILFFCSTFLIGQTNKSEIGIELGPNLRSLRGNEMLEKIDDISFAYSGGLSFQYFFTKTVSLRTNISYERKGFSIKEKASDQYGNPVGEMIFHSDFNYLTIPILARLTLGKKVKLFGNIGPYIGYLLKQTDVTEAYAEFPKSEVDNTDNYNKTDFGISAGLGTKIPIGDKLIFSLEIRDNLGLTNISSIPVINDGSIKTNTTNLLIGIGYKLE